MGRLTYGSLFAGVGGFDLGFDAAGWDCKFQVEWDKPCQGVLKRHWPNVPKWEDVRDVNGAALPPVDLISFGSPCQDLSVAGKRSGLDGERSGLYFEGIRIIKEMRDATNGEYPKWAIWENVPGALTSNKGEDFAEVINQMANIGALGIEWHILDAQWFGVAQRRRRVFVIACWDSSIIRRSAGKILPVPEDSSGNIKKIRKKGKQNSRAIKDGVGETIWYGQTGHSKWTEGGVTLSATDYKRPERNFVLEPFVKTKRAQSAEDYESWDSNKVAPTLNGFDNTGEARATVLVFQPGVMVRQGGGVSEDSSPTLRAEHHNGDNMPHVLIVDGTRVNDLRIYDDDTVPTLKHRMGTGGGQVPLVAIDNNPDVYSFHIKQDPISEYDLSICITEQMGVGVAIPIQGTIINRSDTAGPNGKGFGDLGDPSYTIDARSQHGVMTPELILRRLTPVECERLMGFPDDHTSHDYTGKKIADTNRYKMCGNAIASPVAEWIGKELKKWME